MMHTNAKSSSAEVTLKGLGLRCRSLAATLILCGVLVGFAHAQPSGFLNDTGHGQCFNGATLDACTEANTGNAAAHPRQDGRFGRDASAMAGTLTKIGGGAAGFDFTKVCMSGQLAGQGSCPANPLPGIGLNDWACTKDNVTNLIWSIEMMASSNWATATTAYPNSYNTTTRCGFHSGWRLPTMLELQSIVHYGAVLPAIDTTYFPGAGLGS